jgi:hypothetical protein
VAADGRDKRWAQAFQVETRDIDWNLVSLLLFNTLHLVVTFIAFRVSDMLLIKAHGA